MKVTTDHVLKSPEKIQELLDLEFGIDEKYRMAKQFGASLSIMFDMALKLNSVKSLLQDMEKKAKSIEHKVDISTLLIYLGDGEI